MAAGARDNWHRDIWTRMTQFLNCPQHWHGPGHNQPETHTMNTSKIFLTLSLLLSFSLISSFIVIEDDYTDYQDYPAIDNFSNQQQPLKSQAIRYLSVNVLYSFPTVLYQREWRLQYYEYRVCWNCFPGHLTGLCSSSLRATNVQHWIIFPISWRHPASYSEQYPWQSVPSSSWREGWSASQWWQLNSRNIGITNNRWFIQNRAMN